MDKIVFNYKDENGKENDYTLQFNRESIVFMEKHLGFNALKADERPTSSYIAVTRGAFHMHHPDMKFEDIDHLVNCLEPEDKKDFIEVLFTMLKDAVEALNDKGDKKGNAKWARA